LMVFHQALLCEAFYKRYLAHTHTHTHPHIAHTFTCSHSVPVDFAPVPNPPSAHYLFVGNCCPYHYTLHTHSPPVPHRYHPATPLNFTTLALPCYVTAHLIAIGLRLTFVTPVPYALVFPRFYTVVERPTPHLRAFPTVPPPAHLPPTTTYYHAPLYLHLRLRLHIREPGYLPGCLHAFPATTHVLRSLFPTRLPYPRCCCLWVHCHTHLPALFATCARTRSTAA